MEKIMSRNLTPDQISIYKKHFIKTNLPVKINEYTPLIYRINKLDWYETLPSNYFYTSHGQKGYYTKELLTSY